MDNVLNYRWFTVEFSSYKAKRLIVKKTLKIEIL